MNVVDTDCHGQDYEQYDLETRMLENQDCNYGKEEATAEENSSVYPGAVWLLLFLVSSLLLLNRI